MEWGKIIGLLIMVPYWLFLAGFLAFGVYKAIKDKSATNGIVRLYRRFFGNLYSAEKQARTGRHRNRVILVNSRFVWTGNRFSLS